MQNKLSAIIHDHEEQLSLKKGDLKKAEVRGLDCEARTLKAQIIVLEWSISKLKGLYKQGGKDEQFIY